MAIDMNHIPVGNDNNGGKSEHRGGRGGINMRAINLPDDQPREASKGGRVNLFAIFDPPRLRAEAAAQEARLAEQRRLDDINKQRGMAEARQQIREQGGGTQRTVQLPEIGMGARPALSRLAQTDPEKALKIAQKLVNRARTQNDRMMATQEAGETAKRRTEENRRTLDAHPVSTTQVNFTQSHFLHEGADDTGFIRTSKKVLRGALSGVSALTTIAIRGAIATASGKSSNALDSIRSDGHGIYVDTPLSNVSRVDIGTNLEDYDITANAPPWLDTLVGMASALPGVDRSTILGLVPFGTVAVRRKVGNKIIADAPTFFPGARELELKAAVERIRMPDELNIRFVPEPTLADLLEDAANSFAPEE